MKRVKNSVIMVHSMHEQPCSKFVKTFSYLSELVEVSQALNSWLKYFEDLQNAEPDNLVNTVNRPCIRKRHY